MGICAWDVPIHNFVYVWSGLIWTVWKNPSAHHSDPCYIMHNTEAFTHRRMPHLGTLYPPDKSEAVSEIVSLARGAWRDICERSIILFWLGTACLNVSCLFLARDINCHALVPLTVLRSVIHPVFDMSPSPVIGCSKGRKLFTAAVVSTRFSCCRFPIDISRHTYVACEWTIWGSLFRVR